LAQTSRFGEFLDPVADKLMVAVVLILVVSDDMLVSKLFSSQLFTVVTAVVVGREIAVSALREWMAELGNRGRVAVGFGGKIKTTSQFIAISLLLVGPEVEGFPVLICGELLFYVAGGLTLWSMVVYLKAAWPDLRNH
jgi:CDP-diacylglycerol--glycerol-3-phosphate 3-phosphatidyltransferase